MTRQSTRPSRARRRRTTTFMYLLVDRSTQYVYRGRSEEEDAHAGVDGRRTAWVGVRTLAPWIRTYGIVFVSVH